MLEGEGQSDWMMWTDFVINLVEEDAMAAKIGEAEALKPRTLAEAKCHSDWPLWEKAINMELETLHQAGTWELTKAPPDANIVSSKWVFHAKKDAAGNVIQYKAHLVAQCYDFPPDSYLYSHTQPCAAFHS